MIERRGTKVTTYPGKFQSGKGLVKLICQILLIVLFHRQLLPWKHIHN